MPIDGADRWNTRNKSDPRSSSDLPNGLLCEYHQLLPEQGLALNLAMGQGKMPGLSSCMVSMWLE
jgi:hypothetical protein